MALELFGVERVHTVIYAVIRWLVLDHVHIK